jgi:hypothetical protein
LIRINRKCVPVPSVEKRNENKMNRHQCCCVIFSKDRPLQLHATLESFRDNVEGINAQDVFVIIKASNLEFAKYYRKVKFQFQNFVFIQENNFKQDLVSIVTNPYYSHVLFSVDDNIFSETFQMGYIMQLTDRHLQSIGFSLRLGRNITFCHPMNQNQALKTYHNIESDVLLWNWKDSELDFGYPLEISSSIYRTSLMKHLCQKLIYHNPNTLEHQLDLYKHNLSQSFPWIMSFQISKCFCIPMNITQEEYPNRHSDDPDFTIPVLLNEYQNGFKMNVREIYGRKTDSPHVVIKYNFIHR